MTMSIPILLLVGMFMEAALMVQAFGSVKYAATATLAIINGGPRHLNLCALCYSHLNADVRNFDDVISLKGRASAG